MVEDGLLQLGGELILTTREPAKQTAIALKDCFREYLSWQPCPHGSWHRSKGAPAPGEAAHAWPEASLPDAPARSLSISYQKSLSCHTRGCLLVCTLWHTLSGMLRLALAYGPTTRSVDEKAQLRAFRLRAFKLRALKSIMGKVFNGSIQLVRTCSQPMTIMPRVKAPQSRPARLCCEERTSSQETALFYENQLDKVLWTFTLCPLCRHSDSHGEESGGLTSAPMRQCCCPTMPSLVQCTRPSRRRALFWCWLKPFSANTEDARAAHSVLSHSNGLPVSLSSLFNGPP